MKSKLIIIRGNSGAGKTTVAKALQKTLGRGTILVSQDVVRREMMFVKDGKDNPAIGLMKQIVIYGYGKSEFVIVEGITATKWYRKMFDELIAHFDYKYYAYYYDLPFEETVKRHHSKPNAHEFEETEMKRWWNKKDFLNLEKEKVITYDHSVSDTINLILKDIQFSYGNE
jgi:predicted kinase